MNLEEHYDRMWREALGQFENSRFDYDPFIDSEKDKRCGITLLARPPQKNKALIAQMLNDLRSIAPEQYYYPPSDLHITVMSIISCYDGFTLDMIEQERYIEKIADAVQQHKPFEVEYIGITASPACVLIQGFPKNEGLSRLRNNIRESFSQSMLQHSIDSRYAIQTAHSTVIRFRKKVAQAEAFIGRLSSYRTASFGVFEVNELELVFNDWYQRKKNTVLLKKFILNG